MLFKMRPVDGRLNFYQWETNRRLTIPNGITGVQFYNDSDPDKTRSVPVMSGNDSIAVPDEFLMNNGFLVAIPYDDSTETGDWCKYTQRFRIDARPKPSDYNYISTDELQNEINTLKDEVGKTVKYTEQFRTDDEKAIARENINAFDKYNGLKPTTLSFPTFSRSGKQDVLVYTNTLIDLPDTEEADDATKDAMFSLYQLITTHSESYTVKDDISGIAPLIEAGCFGYFFGSEHNYENAITVQDDPINPWLEFKLYVYDATSKTYGIEVLSNNGYKLGMAYSISEAKFKPSMELRSHYLFKYTSKQDTNPTLPQVEMTANPTKAMDIATKQYVDTKVGEPLDGSDAVVDLAETGLILPMFQNGTFYTDADSSVYLI